MSHLRTLSVDHNLSCRMVWWWWMIIGSDWCGRQSEFSVALLSFELHTCGIQGRDITASVSFLSQMGLKARHNTLTTSGAERNFAAIALNSTKTSNVTETVKQTMMEGWRGIGNLYRTGWSWVTLLCITAFKREKCPLVSSCPSVCPHVLARPPTGCISVKFGIGNFY